MAAHTALSARARRGALLSSEYPSSELLEHVMSPRGFLRAA